MVREALIDGVGEEKKKQAGEFEVQKKKALRLSWAALVRKNKRAGFR